MSKPFDMTISSEAQFLSKDITIHWVRHAESCANFKGANFIDENLYPDRTVGYEKLTDLYINKLKQQRPSKTKKQLIDITSKLSPSALKNLVMYHPNLSFIGMQQAILLGSNFVQKQLPYDAVFVSPSLRTIMTALLAFRGTNQTIIVVPFIVEHLNLAGKFDYVNAPLAIDKLKKYVTFVKEWLEKNWINNFDDIEIMTLLYTISNTIQEIGTLFHTINNKIREIKPNYKPDDDPGITLARIQGLQNFKCWKETKFCSEKPTQKGCNKIRADACIDVDKCGYDKKRIDCKENPKNIQKPYFVISQLMYKIAMVDYDGLHKLSQTNSPSIKKLLKDIIELMPAVLDAVKSEKNEYKNLESNLKYAYTETNSSDAYNSAYKKLNDAYIRLDKIMVDPSSYARGPTVDFSWLENYRNKPAEYNEINMEKFYTEILCRFLVEPHRDETKIKIMCISHGASLRKYFGEKYSNQSDKPTADLKNTQVYEEQLKVYGKDFEHINTIQRRIKTLSCNKKKFVYVFNKIDYKKYDPLPIRTKYENFEIANIDVCQLRGLKGVLHYAIADPKNANKILSLKTDVGDVLRRKQTELKDYVTPDLKFHFEDPVKKYMTKSSDMKITGGYYDKYMKYKYKYLQLKQQINSNKAI